MATTKTIMGIDPGTRTMGFGIITIQGNMMQAICIDELDLKKIDNPYHKLRQIYQHTFTLISQYTPDEVALEAPFFGENVQSMLKLGRAQGVAMAAALNQGVEVTEYAPTKVKTAVCGNAHASKEQLGKTVCRLLHLKTEELETGWDSTDALAVALCHYFQHRSLSIPQPKKSSTKKSTKSGWDSFLQQNTHRIVK